MTIAAPPGYEPQPDVLAWARRHEAVTGTACRVVVSPDELNEHLRTVIVAPMTTGGRAYPWRPRWRFQNRAGFIALDQLRTVDADRLVKPLGRLESSTVLAVLHRLQEMFAE